MKIKKVNIVGFRSYAYEGDGLFDFVGPCNEISNFVAIFGPNGFGKSSIYDAIEWSITNSISRFNRDSQRISNNAISLALNQKGVSQHILRNRYIDDDAPSFVIVETTIHPPFNRSVKKAKLGSRDYKFDPKEADTSTKHLSEIFLSQDAIDSFLKEERAESRYEKFMAAFGGEDELYRQKLAVLKRISRNEKEKLSSKIEAIQPDLSVSVQEDAITHVLHTLSRIEKYHLQFENVGLDFDATKNLENQNRILNYREEYSNKIENIKNSVRLVDIASANVPEYFETISRINYFEKELLLKIQHRDAMTSINNIYSEIHILENSRNSVLNSLSDCNLRNENISKFFDNKEKIKSASNNIDQLRRAKNSFQGIIAENNSTKISKNILLVEKRQRLIKEQNAIAELPTIFLTLEEIENDLDSLVSDKNELVDDRPDLLNDKKLALVSREEIAGMVIEKSMSPESILRVTGSSEISHQLGALRKDEIDVTNRLKSYRDLLSELVSRDEDVSEIVRLGSELLSHTHSDTCPLCSYRYETHEELFQRIHSSNGISREKRSILQFIENDETKLSAINEDISKFILKITALRDQQVSLKDITVNEAISLIQKCDSTINDLNLQIQKLHEKKTEIIKKTMGLTKPVAQEHLESSIADLISTIDKIEAEISEINSNIETSRKSIAEIETNIAQEEGVIITNTDDHSYAFVFTYLKENGVLDGQEKYFIEKNITDLNSKYNSLIAEIDQKNTQIKITQGSLLKYNFPNELGLVEQKIASLEENIRDAKSSLRSMWDSLISAGANKQNTGIVSIEVVTRIFFELREKNESERETCVEVLNILDLLSKQFELVLKFSESSQLKDRIRLLNESISAHENFEKTLDKEYSEVEAILKNNINEFFYSNLINDIYSKIDPHPTFKIIEFSSVFPENGDKPRLEIFLREKCGEPISPNLYFSAAQLNVLSLSIFLARALHVTHKGEPVRTILIDDPIQSMDSINILSTIDLLRGISQKFDRQIILSTHDENFYELLKMKVPSSKFNSKFIKLSEHGKVEVDSGSGPQLGL